MAGPWSDDEFVQRLLAFDAELTASLPPMRRTVFDPLAEEAAALAVKNANFVAWIAGSDAEPVAGWSPLFTGPATRIH